MDIILGTKPEHTDFYITRSQIVDNVTDWIERAPGDALLSMDMWAAALMQAGKKIQAVKLIRIFTGMGLKQSKDYVEERWNHLYLKARKDMD